MATNFVSETEDSQTTNMVKKEEAPLLTDSGKKLLRYTKRFYALFLICSVEIGYNFSTGFAGPLENAIIARTGIQKKSIIGLFTSLYSLPNIFLPLVAGIVVDKLGPRVCITVFCSIIMFGLIIAMIGGFLTGEASMIVLQTGNFVFALGAECLFVAYNTVTGLWFLGKELAFAFSIQMAVGGIASSFEPLVLVVVAGPQGQHLGWALSICVGLALYSLLAALILAKLDKDAEVDEIKNGLTKKVEVEKFSMNDLKQLTTLFWLLNIDDLFLVAASMSFMQFFMGFYTTVYNITSGYAAGIATITGFVSIFLYPLIGKFIDKHGKRGLILLLSCVVQVISYVLYLVVPNCSASLVCDQTPPFCSTEPYGALLPPNILNGVAGAMINVGLFGSIPLVNEPRLLGTAFGILDCFQQLGGVILPITSGWIIDQTNNVNGWCGYRNLVWYMIFITLINIVLSFVLYVHDLRCNKILELPQQDKKPEGGEEEVDFKKRRQSSMMHIKRSVII